jgi:alkanesulfonate monooxygenase SsuD/methylene tetrahydromethanopterin reductase-like flavin-dependent oxidoreductase (luciferase family)
VTVDLDVSLGTSILNVYSRSPALLGQTAATLGEVSAGQFRLGVGPSGPVLIEGWHALMLTREGLRDRLEDLRRGAELGGRDPGDLRVTLTVPCLALADGERARQSARNHLAFYVGAMGTFYRDSLSRQGYEETASEVAIEWANGNHGAAMDAISDELLDALGAVGTPEECRQRIDEWTNVDGVDAVSVSFPRDATPAEIRATIRALAPE